MQATQDQSLGLKDSLEKGMATHSSIFCLKNSMDRGAWQATVHGVTELDTTVWLTFAFIQIQKERCSLFYSLYFFSQYVCFENKFGENSWERNSSYYMGTFEAE